MQIIEKSAELKTTDLYHLTMNPATRKMKDCKGQRLEIDCWCIYEDVMKSNKPEQAGVVQEILAIKTPEGEVFATNSPTLIDDFRKMWELFTSNGETVKAINIISGTSKAGREFITCVYAG